mmetsp:Transcript_7650/g.18891  ORF Transcript_7650/g.18891 Transcript_7650/m.18891 type:complete len:246 (+) Transcript_7650:593-1330(+)
MSETQPLKRAGGAHREHHFTDSALVRDIVLGLSDGLTVPFALAAGLSGAFSSSKPVVLAVLAELAAGAVSMGLGGYMSGKTEVDHYATERAREAWEIRNIPDAEVQEIHDILRPYGLVDTQIAPLIAHFRQNQDKWIDFMMRFELGLEEPDPAAPLRSALAVGASYVAGGLLPVMPYFVVEKSAEALRWSVAVTVVALFGFGVAKGAIMGQAKWKSGAETMAVGIVAAAAAYGMAVMFRSWGVGM